MRRPTAGARRNDDGALVADNVLSKGQDGVNGRAATANGTMATPSSSSSAGTTSKSDFPYRRRKQRGGGGPTSRRYRSWSRVVRFKGNTDGRSESIRLGLLCTLTLAVFLHNVSLPQTHSDHHLFHHHFSVGDPMPPLRHTPIPSTFDQRFKRRKPSASTNSLRDQLQNEAHRLIRVKQIRPHHLGHNAVRRPLPVSEDFRKQARQLDFGTIEVAIMEDDRARRLIHHDFHLDKSEVLKGDNDDRDPYYAFDDDVERNPYAQFEDDSLLGTRQCRMVQHHLDQYLNCNSFHEYDMARAAVHERIHYLGGGSYRAVYRADQEDTNDSVVFKISSWDNEGGDNFIYADYEYMRMDATVAALLSGNPHIVDTYGFCALSQWGELMPHGDVEGYAVPEYERGMQVDVPLDGAYEQWNYFTPTEKLVLALQMAEAVAELHNFHGGVIIHDDIQLSQFLLTNSVEEQHLDDPTVIQLKLNDFNRAEFQLYDVEHGEYCHYKNGHGHGDWRAPEEYHDKPLDEKIDIWSLGNNFYSLLTGLYPFYDLEKAKDVQNAVKHGKLAELDTSRWHEMSFPEGKLAEIIGTCWAYEPVDRPDIAKLVSMLRAAVQENQKKRPPDDDSAHKAHHASSHSHGGIHHEKHAKQAKGDPDKKTVNATTDRAAKKL